MHHLLIMVYLRFEQINTIVFVVRLLKNRERCRRHRHRHSTVIGLSSNVLSAQPIVIDFRLMRTPMRNVDGKTIQNSLFRRRFWIENFGREANTTRVSDGRSNMNLIWVALCLLPGLDVARRLAWPDRVLDVYFELLHCGRSSLPHVGFIVNLRSPSSRGLWRLHSWRSHNLGLNLIVWPFGLFWQAK